MEHLGTKRIETQRLILRPFVQEDAQAMYENWCSDPEVTKYLTWPAYTSVDTAHEILDIWTKEYKNKNFYQWAIELKELGQPIGSISVVEQKEKAKVAHIGYCLGRNWWNQGIMSETLKAVMDFLFDEVGFNRLESRHDPNNPNSGKVMAKCGMKYECTMRQADWNNQGTCDASWYALLKEAR